MLGACMRYLKHSLWRCRKFCSVTWRKLFLEKSKNQGLLDLRILSKPRFFQGKVFFRWRYKTFYISKVNVSGISYMLQALLFTLVENYDHMIHQWHDTAENVKNLEKSKNQGFLGPQNFVKKLLFLKRKLTSDGSKKFSTHPKLMFWVSKMRSKRSSVHS